MRRSVHLVAVIVALSCLAVCTPSAPQTPSAPPPMTTTTSPGAPNSTPVLDGVIASLRAAGCEAPGGMDFRNVAQMFPKDAARYEGLFQLDCTSATLSCAQLGAAWPNKAPPEAKQAVLRIFDATGGDPRCIGHFDRAGTKLPDLDILQKSKGV